MTPNRAKRLLAVMFTFLLASTSVWCADKEPGGRGTLVSNSHTKHCFETDSSTVQKVCADYQINWKLWTLMGEPVGNYTLSWKLTGIEFRDQRRDGSRLLRFSPDSLPQELQKAASAIELYIDGHVAVDVAMTSSVHLLGLRHRFNTGAAVRAGSRQSYNVPGSSSWSNVFVHYYPCKPDAAKQSTVDPKTAQEAFKQGINLHSLELCPESGVSGLTALENAVDKLCSKPGADGKYAFCPKQEKMEKKDEARQNTSKQNSEGSTGKGKNKIDNAAATGLGASVLDGAEKSASDSIHSLLDESAERSAIQKRLVQETASYRRTAEAACQGMLRDIDACYARAQCSRPQPPAGVSETDCQTARAGLAPAIDKLVLIVRDWDCDSKCEEKLARNREESREEERKERARKAREWHAKWDPIKARCEPYYEQQKRYSQCEKSVRQTCNPQNLNNLNDCTKEQMRTKGPTEKDARKLMQKEWEQRSRTGSSITNSILD